MWFLPPVIITIAAVSGETRARDSEAASCDAAAETSQLSMSRREAADPSPSTTQAAQTVPCKRAAAARDHTLSDPPPSLLHSKQRDRGSGIWNLESRPGSGSRDLESGDLEIGSLLVAGVGHTGGRLLVAHVRLCQLLVKLPHLR
eukprot:3423485-Rhodomonas_salina.5